MLRSLKDLERYTLSALDGDIGKVADFLLDDARWTIRYLVAETGGFIDDGRVLLSPLSIRSVDPKMACFHLALTIEKIRSSPSVDTDRPVSRQHERDFFGYYGYPYYWGGSGLWGMGSDTPTLGAGPANDAALHAFDTADDPHLRSEHEVRGYHVQGSDDRIGHIDDFIVDERTWQVRYLVIDTSNWWLGKKVLISPRWVTRVSWGEHLVHVDMSRASIEKCPEWNGNAALEREYEDRLHNHYGRGTVEDRGTHS